jgi:hypothetical protein
MFKIESVRSRSRDDLREIMKQEIPGMEPALHIDAKPEHLEELLTAMNDGQEEAIHQVLAAYPFLLKFLFESTGHHGVWVKSKPQIAMPSFNGGSGKIPDFLVCAKNSDGFRWAVVELKRPSHNICNSDADGLSTQANKGITQLMQYLSYIEEHQSSIRDLLAVPELRSPLKGLLLIGSSEETEADDRKRIMKRIWNSRLKDIEIISYSRLAGRIQQELEFKKSRS